MMNRARNRNQFAQVELFERLDTPVGYFFWNPSKLVTALLAALLMAFVGMACGTVLTGEVWHPVASALFGMFSAAVCGPTAGLLVLLEGGKLQLS